MVLNLSSLGAYPDQTYYDPNRPSWLPYFIDTPTESASKYGTTNVIGQMGGVVGVAATDVGSVAGEAVGSAINSAINEATGGVDTSSTISSWTTIAMLAAAGFLLFALKK